MIGYGIAFIAVAAVALYALIFAKGHWIVKAIMIPLVASLTILVMVSLNSFKGWPYQGIGLPKEFSMKAVTISEPVGGSPGGIYVMLLGYKDGEVPFYEYEGDIRQPRLIELPYSKELHKMAQEWQKELKKGGSVVGKLSKGKAGEQGKPGDPDGKMGPNHMGSWNDSWGQEYRFHKLPPAVPPQKGPGYWKSDKGK